MSQYSLFCENEYHLKLGLSEGASLLPCDRNQSKNRNSKAVQGPIRRQLAKFPRKSPGKPSRLKMSDSKSILLIIFANEGCQIKNLKNKDLCLLLE